MQAIFEKSYTFYCVSFYLLEPTEQFPTYCVKMYYNPL